MVEEVAKDLGVLRTFDYNLIRQLNKELEMNGFPTKRDVIEWD